MQMDKIENREQEMMQKNFAECSILCIFAEILKIQANEKV